VCRRGEINQSVSIRNLKRHAAEHDTEKLWEKRIQNKESTEKRIAVVGSGPAGLTAAYYLKNQGHAVTVYDSMPAPGGMMRYGIPEYRLPREILDEEISVIEKRGVEIRTKTRIESIDNLFEDGYDAVLVSIGAQKGAKLSIPGAGNQGVWVGLDFLRCVNAGEDVTIGNRVVVLGGGNVAFDCARVARRIGAEHVSIVCLESREDMPAAWDEIDQGEEEGISVCPSKTSTRILSDNGRVSGVELLDVASFSFDEDMNPEIEIIEDSYHVMEADTVVFAVGQSPDIPE
jgi:NADPH-dependent glutamate synthase beta subunit-like oxidoreductase